MSNGIIGKGVVCGVVLLFLGILPAVGSVGINTGENGRELIDMEMADIPVVIEKDLGQISFMFVVGLIKNLEIDGNSWEFEAVSIWYISCEGSSSNGLNLEMGHSMGDFYSITDSNFHGITLQGFMGKKFIIGSFTNFQ